MSYSPLALTRRHVLGDLYARCDRIGEIPVYLNDPDSELLGYVDESLGHYADAFLFRLPEDICKKLSAGHFLYSFNYGYADDASVAAGKRRVVLSSICLTMRPTAPRAKQKVPALA